MAATPRLQRRPAPFAERTAPNRPAGQANREAALRMRLRALGEQATDLQIEALSRVLYQHRAEAYRLAIQREARTWGAQVYGRALDPYIDAGIRHAADLAARQVTATYLRDLAAARDRGLAGEELRIWMEHRAAWKAPQVLLYEYGRSDFAAQRDFYRENALDATAHVEPGDAVVPDICEDLIGLGEVPVADAMDAELPAHQFCPHFWVVTRADGAETDLGDESQTEGEAAPPEGEPASESATASLPTGTVNLADLLSALGGGSPPARASSPVAGLLTDLLPNVALYLRRLWLAGFGARAHPETMPLLLAAAGDEGDDSEPDD